LVGHRFGFSHLRRGNRLVVLAYDTALRVASALLSVAGVRLIVVGTVQLRNRATSSTK